MTNDTNFYLIALEQFRDRYPMKKRAADCTLEDLSTILRDAQELKRIATETAIVDFYNNIDGNEVR